MNLLHLRYFIALAETESWTAAAVRLSIDAKKICSAPLMLAVHKGHALAERESVSIKELQNESFIFTTNEYTLQGTCMKLCRENGLEPKVVDYSIFDNRIRAVAKRERRFVH